MAIVKPFAEFLQSSKTSTKACSAGESFLLFVAVVIDLVSPLLSSASLEETAACSA